MPTIWSNLQTQVSLVCCTFLSSRAAQLQGPSATVCCWMTADLPHRLLVCTFLASHTQFESCIYQSAVAVKNNRLMLLPPLCRRQCVPGWGSYLGPALSQAQGSCVTASSALGPKIASFTRASCPTSLQRICSQGFNGKHLISLEQSLSELIAPTNQETWRETISKDSTSGCRKAMQLKGFHPHYNMIGVSQSSTATTAIITLG